VVVPGFFGTKENAVVASLGRGGSDLSAVLLAQGLEAVQCELVKDVHGYFTADPTIHQRAQHLPRLSYDEALEMADAGCELVQQRAVEAARAARLQLVVRSLDDAAPITVVSDEGDAKGERLHGSDSTAEWSAQDGLTEKEQRRR
jgi:aspartate kinase